ncbi:MAG: molybdopterin molybdotransferase MoeA [Planctomycetota bacterium]
MLGVDEARHLIASFARPVTDVESLPLEDAAGRVLVRPVVADRDDPPFDRSMMDGYALRAADLPGRLEVVARIAAGDVDLPSIGSGQAAWINTGAALPSGADTVVPVEDTTGEVEVARAREAGSNVLGRGTLVRAGDPVAVGPLSPERIAVCAAQGAFEVSVARRLSVAVLSTGSELAADPGHHEIRNSNGPLLRALLRRHNQVVDLGEVGDDPARLAAALERGLAADVLVTTGGVSKGELDLVRPELEKLGVTIEVHGVALQPGKPVLFGTHAGGAVFGLPGNPASALVTADLFLLPFLAARAGRRAYDDVPLRVRGTLAAPVKASPRRRRVFPCDLRDGTVHPLPWRSSADLYTLTRGNAYLIVEAGRDLAAGDEIHCLLPER